jgi:hypothetical protein
MPRDIPMLQDKVNQLSTDFGRFVGKVSALQSASAGIQVFSEEGSSLQSQIGQKLNDPVVEQLSTDFIELCKEVLILESQIAAILLTVVRSPTQPPSPFPPSLPIPQPSPPITSTPSPNQLPPPFAPALQPFSSVRNQSSRPSPPSLQPRSVASLGSRIISDVPTIFAEFRKKQFSLLLRGSRDGFEAQEFHLRCDGHANTLTVILNTKGNIFGGFTPVEWESGEPHYKADDSLKSFVFTLKNPHNIPARRFALKDENNSQAIYCYSK